MIRCYNIIRSFNLNQSPFELLFSREKLLTLNFSIASLSKSCFCAGAVQRLNVTQCHRGLHIIRPLGYERVYLLLHKVADTPFHIQWSIMYIVYVSETNDCQTTTIAVNNKGSYDALYRAKIRTLSAARVKLPLYKVALTPFQYYKCELTLYSPYTWEIQICFDVLNIILNPTFLFCTNSYFNSFLYCGCYSPTSTPASSRRWANVVSPTSGQH